MTAQTLPRFLMGIAAFLAISCASNSYAFLGSPAQYDYDGDNISDPAVYYPDGGLWFALRSSDGGVTQGTVGGAEQRAVVGDFDGDGKDDFGTYQRQTYQWRIRLSGSGQTVTLVFGTDNARAVPADYDGDGKTDLAVYRRLNGTWHIFYSSSGQSSVVNWGWNETRAVPNDYDGDGKADLAVFHRATATWYIRRSTDGQMQTQQWGWSQTRPVSADYDGDGKADIAVYHLATGNWYILQTSTGTMRVQNWGWVSARPVPGEFDGDGKVDLAVYHRAAGNWYILKSSDGGGRLQPWGWDKAGAVPSYRDGGIQNLIILAFGDSITYGTSSSSDSPLTGYPLLLERKCEPLLGGHCVTVNSGNPGEKTSDGKSRLIGDLLTQKPDLTMLMQGTNDLFFETPYGVLEGNLRQMVASILASGSSCILATIPPVITNQYRDRSRQAQLIRGFNPRIFGIASTYRIPVADVYAAITAVPNWQNLLMDQPTANHPNDAGYRVVRDTFLRQVELGTLSGLFY